MNNIVQSRAANMSEYMVPDWLNAEQSTGVSFLT